jgi:rod shape determining protein RodA
MTWRDHLQSLDWILVSATLLLVLVGLAMMVSAGSGQGIFSGLAIRQTAALGVSLIVFFGLTRIPYHAWRRWALPVYIAGMLGLLIVTALGQVVRGTVSRLEFFGWQIQPSEFMKIGLVVMLAWLFSRYRNIRFQVVLGSAVIALVPVAFVVAEPDMGMAALLLGLWVGMLMFSGLPWRNMLMLAVIGVGLAVVGWQTVLLPYQKDRIATFLNPQADPLAAGYNVTQSVIAFGSGQLFGRGLGHGPQSQLKFLPERHTDFILASLGEELGFMGVVLVVGLYCTLLWRIVVIAQRTNDVFGQLLCIGVFFVLLTGFAVSAGMNIGLLPVTGIPLPLLSYGGSNLLATFFLLGIVQSVHVYSRFVQKAAPEIAGIM